MPPSYWSLGKLSEISSTKEIFVSLWAVWQDLLYSLGEGAVLLYHGQEMMGRAKGFHAAYSEWGIHLVLTSFWYPRGTEDAPGWDGTRALSFDTCRTVKAEFFDPNGDEYLQRTGERVISKSQSWSKYQPVPHPFMHSTMNISSWDHS